MAKRPVQIPELKADTTKPGEAGAEMLIAWIFLALGESEVTYQKLADHLKITVEAIKSWKHKGGKPTLQHLVAALEFLGYRLVPVLQTESPDPATDYYPIDEQWWRLVEARRAQRLGRV